MSCGEPVGLDVEASDRHTKTNVLKLAERRLASSELASLQGASLLALPSELAQLNQTELFSASIV